MSKKLLTIFGATGNQGGSVIATILGSQSLSSKYALRAITRDPNKANAQALASKGVELAKADLDDTSSLTSAIKGSYGVFAVTDYWSSTSKDVEFSQGKNIVDACKAEGVKHLVWSTLPNVTELTGGELTKVEHFDSKAAVADYAAKVKGDGFLVSNFMPGFFMSNLLGMIKKQEGSSNVALNLPWDGEKTWVPLLDIRGDTGKYVAGLFEAGAKADGVFVQGASQWVHPNDIVKVVSEASGKEVKFEQAHMTVEIAATLPRIPEEMTQNMLLVRDYSYFGKGAEKNQEESDKYLAEGTQKTSFEAFAKAQKWSF